MRISALLQSARPLFSFEFFPPKTPQGEAALFRTLHELKPLQPAFVSITYGAGGSERSKTAQWAARIQQEVGLVAMAHLTRVGHSRQELLTILQEYARVGVQNSMALRGDPPKGAREFQPVSGGFRYASELIALIRAEFGDTFTVAGGGYPEGHPEAVSLEADLHNLKRKVEAGLDFVVTSSFLTKLCTLALLSVADGYASRVPLGRV